MNFWKENLNGSPTNTWPTSPKDTSAGNAIVRHHVPLEVRPTEFTLAIIAQAAFTLLFSIQTNSDDVIFGMTFSGRDAALHSIPPAPLYTRYHSAPASIEPHR